MGHERGPRAPRTRGRAPRGTAGGGSGRGARRRPSLLRDPGGTAAGGPFPTAPRRASPGSESRLSAPPAAWVRRRTVPWRSWTATRRSAPRGRGINHRVRPAGGPRRPRGVQSGAGHARHRLAGARRSGIGRSRPRGTGGGLLAFGRPCPAALRVEPPRGRLRDRHDTAPDRGRRTLACPHGIGRAAGADPRFSSERRGERSAGASGHDPVPGGPPRTLVAPRHMAVRRFRRRGGTDAPEWASEVESPDGSARNVEGGAPFTPLLAGVYTVRGTAGDGATAEAHFAANVPATEADPTPIAQDDLEELFAGRPVFTAGPEATAWEEGIFRARRGWDIAPWLIALALALVGIELFLATPGRSRRPSADGEGSEVTSAFRADSSVVRPARASRRNPGGALAAWVSCACTSLAGRVTGRTRARTRRTRDGRADRPRGRCARTSRRAIRGSAHTRRHGRSLLPAARDAPVRDADPHVEIEAQRVDAMSALLSGHCRILVTTARALAERAPIPVGAGRTLALRIADGQTHPLADLGDRLEGMGFSRTYTVREVGDYAIRGGIVDLFPFGHSAPLPDRTVGGRGRVAPPLRRAHAALDRKAGGRGGAPDRTPGTGERRRL